MIILIAHHKGGVGKSTLAVNLAAEGQRRGADVLIAEADPTVHTSRRWTQTRQEAGAKPITCTTLEGNIQADLRDLAGRFDHVVVDVAGKDSREMRSAMLIADVMISPILPSQSDVDETQLLVQTVEQARDFNPNLITLAVLNRCPTSWNSSEADEAIDYLGDYPELSLAKILIHDRKAYRTSIEKGLGVVELKDGKANSEIRRLMDEILEAGNGH